MFLDGNIKQNIKSEQQISANTTSQLGDDMTYNNSGLYLYDAKIQSRNR